ncbi:hypothetical protein TNCV_676671 [Trichonephila clavipes]|nr:hypothetical protein TNCV_676671 [Trichonephila clavipes]
MRKSFNDKMHPPADDSYNVTIPIPDVDKAKSTVKSLIAVILWKTNVNMYQLGTKVGVIIYTPVGVLLLCIPVFIPSTHLYMKSEFKVKTPLTSVTSTCVRNIR